MPEDQVTATREEPEKPKCRVVKVGRWALTEYGSLRLDPVEETPLSPVEIQQRREERKRRKARARRRRKDTKDWQRSVSPSKAGSRLYKAFKALEKALYSTAVDRTLRGIQPAIRARIDALLVKLDRIEAQREVLKQEAAEAWEKKQMRWAFATEKLRQVDKEGNSLPLSEDERAQHRKVAIALTRTFGRIQAERERNKATIKALSEELNFLYGLAGVSPDLNY